MRVFVAGASGVIGRRLVRILVAAGHEVTGMTRRPARAERIEQEGCRAAVVDVFDADRLVRVVSLARPEVVIHQLTDLAVPNPSLLDTTLLQRTARLRDEGTANLIVAAVAAGAGRVIAQGIAWVRPSASGRAGGDEAPSGSETVTERGVRSLERRVLGDSRFDGLVLRYGRLYGPGTWTETPPEPPTVHVDAAAYAAALAVDHGSPGAYDVVDDGGPVTNERAGRELGWRPGWRMGETAP